jgi:hypothetical protein
MATPVGSAAQCAVSHAPGYVPGAHSGDIRLYESTQSTGLWWLCDADAASAPDRGVSVVLVEDHER